MRLKSAELQRVQLDATAGACPASGTAMWNLRTAEYPIVHVKESDSG